MDLSNKPVFTERVHRNYRDKFTVVWMVNRECNFKCKYCYGTDEISMRFLLADFMEAWKRHIPHPARLMMTGGEPLLKRWLPTLAQAVIDNGDTIELQSNWSVNTAAFMDTVDPKGVDIIETSYHPDARREWGGEKAIAEYIDNYQCAEDRGFNITTWLIDDPRISQEQYLKECRHLYNNGIIPHRKRYCGDEGGGLPGDAIWVPGKLCRAGHFGVNMWEHFEITPCDHDRTKLGNLFTGIELYDAPKPCQKAFCGCLGREWLVDKHYDEFYKKEFGG